MNIVRWNPHGEIVSLRETMDKLFEDSWVWLRPLAWPVGDGMPTVDVYQTDDDLVIKATVPGLKPEEIDVTVEGDTLTIRGETKFEEEAKDQNYIYRERRRGSFCRQVVLPATVVIDKADARMENGILTLTLPKAEEVKPRQIRINVQPLLEHTKTTEEKAKK